ncbi:MAG: SGNH/GDSL hydrolase family protein [Cocleimonas sp.]
MNKRPSVCSYEECYESEAISSFCDPSFHTQKIIAEGDSWFTIGGLRLKNPWFSNILYTLRFQKQTLILNLAEPGDTLKHISSIPKNHHFKSAIEEHTIEPWNAILLSAGGNDLIDKVHTLVLNKLERVGKTIDKPKDYCNLVAVDNFLNNIESHYRRLAAIRGVHDIPMIVHTYDYPTPNNSPSRFFGIGLLGPWLHPAMTNAEIPKNDWIALSDYLFDRLGNRLLALSKNPNRIPNFHVIDTRNTILRAKKNQTGESEDWLNEIHPNKNGYKKIARLIEQQLKIVAGVN